jgi:hypothetical protein
MALMPGMGGMKTPPKPKTTSKSAVQRSASPATPGMKMAARDSRGASKVSAAHSQRRIPVKKDATGMTGMAGMSAQGRAHAGEKKMSMRDTTGMSKSTAPEMPGIPDTVAMKTMPGMRDTTTMSAMPGMRDSAATKAAAKEMAGMPGMRDTAGQKPMANMPGMNAASDTTRMGTMSMVPDPLGVTMERMGSGTTWIPDAVSLPSRRFKAAQWDLMLHTFVFGQYGKQGGPRGGSQLGSLNWAMIMASHELAGGRFQARTMLSLDAAGVTPRGYPLLLQTGESYHGEPLHDRQHPHDFWMELGGMYERPVRQTAGISLYAAPSGEPALGPVAFMHRPSATDNPFAPIGHHWQDATHVSFGVLTAGVFTHEWKLEGSVFNGREPDENRWDFDPLKLDSYSGRLSINPNAHWALSAGYGYLAHPEILSPTESMHRVTASAIYGTTLGAGGQWATTFVWGANKHSTRPGLSHSLLAESEANLDRSNTVLARAEFVQKTAGDLELDTPQFGFATDRSFNVSALSLGYIRELAEFWHASLGLGAMGTVNVVPSALTSAYGSRTPVGEMVFLRLRAARMPGVAMGGMEGVKPMGNVHE